MENNETKEMRYSSTPVDYLKIRLNVGKTTFECSGCGKSCTKSENERRNLCQECNKEIFGDFDPTDL